MSFDPDEVNMILSTTTQEITKKWVGTPLDQRMMTVMQGALKEQVSEILSKFSYLGGFEIDKNDIHIEIDHTTFRVKIMLGGETAKKFVGE